MTEYIDKGIAINIIEMTDHTGYSIECVTDITDLAVKAIKEMPTADVVEVVHGEWIAEEIHNCWTEFECSVCKFKHKSVHNLGRPMTEFNYCPNCGADMRGGDNG